jgi:hypothetical protein
MAVLGPRLEFMDKVCVAASSAELGCTNCPTWELEVQGAMNPVHLRQALGWLLRRYWPARSTVVPVGGDLLRCTRLDFKVAQDFDVDEFLDVIETDEPGLLEVQERVRDRHLDWTCQWPLHVTLVRLGDDRSHLLIQQQHGLADGRAFMEMLGDLKTYLDIAAQGGEPGSELLEPVIRRGELEPMRLSRFQTWWWGLQGWGWLVFMLLRGIVRPLKPLFQNIPTDYRGANRTLHLDMDDAVLAQWRPRYKAAGLSLNTVLTVAFFLANQRWNADHGVQAGKTNAFLVAETRPRDGSFQSFANHLASFVVDLPLHREWPIIRYLQHMHGQISFAARHQLQLKRFIFERAMALKLPVGLLRKAVLEPSTVPINLNFSNLISLPFPRLEGPGWVGTRWRITTPVTPRTSVVLTVIRYRGQLTFNFNHKANIVSRDQLQGLVAHFQQALQDVVAALPQVPG